MADTGSGISEADQARVFDAFYRGSQAGRFPQGLGLGLTIAYDLVAAHGGRLEMESTPGAGSRFTIRLPLSRDAEAAALPQSACGEAADE